MISVDGIILCWVAIFAVSISALNAVYLLKVNRQLSLLDATLASRNKELHEKALQLAAQTTEMQRLGEVILRMTDVILYFSIPENDPPQGNPRQQHSIQELEAARKKIFEIRKP